MMRDTNVLYVCQPAIMTITKMSSTYSLMILMNAHSFDAIIVLLV